MLDLYHAQIGEGNLIALLKRADPFLGEAQVADVPGRCEPGTGEISYSAIAMALGQTGYRGAVGLEAYASGEDDVALERFPRCSAQAQQPLLDDKRTGLIGAVALRVGASLRPGQHLGPGAVRLSDAE